MKTRGWWYFRSTIDKIKIYLCQWAPMRNCVFFCPTFPCISPVRDNYNLKTHKYVCITTCQPDTKYNPNPNPGPHPTTKQHAMVNIQLLQSHVLRIQKDHTRQCCLHRLCDLGFNSHTAVFSFFRKGVTLGTRRELRGSGLTGDFMLF